MCSHSIGIGLGLKGGGYSIKRRKTIITGAKGSIQAAGPYLDFFEEKKSMLSKNYGKTRESLVVGVFASFFTRLCKINRKSVFPLPRFQK